MGEINIMSNTIVFFGKKIVEQVRDNAIRSCDQNLEKRMQSPIAKRWRKKKEEGNIEELQKAMIADCVDEIIFQLLNAIDQADLHISITTTNGKIVDLSEEGLGELAGWYMGSGGWRAERYSKPS